MKPICIYTSIDIHLCIDIYIHIYTRIHVFLVVLYPLYLTSHYKASMNQQGALLRPESLDWRETLVVVWFGATVNILDGTAILRADVGCHMGLY